MVSTPEDTTAPAWTYLMDMDGVLVHEDALIPGADAFLSELRSNETPFMVLTNNSIRTPRDLRARLQRTGLDIPEESIWTSALATATFLANQRPEGTAYVVGESGLTTALHDIGYVLTDSDPETGVRAGDACQAGPAPAKRVRRDATAVQGAPCDRPWHRRARSTPST